MRSKSAIERLYGPQAGAQIRPEHVVSFRLQPACNLSSGQHHRPDQRKRPASDDAARERCPDQRRLGGLRDDGHFARRGNVYAGPRSARLPRRGSSKRRAWSVIALAAPTYLSSTEISQFAAYYGLYSTISALYRRGRAGAVSGEHLRQALRRSACPPVGYDVCSRSPRRSTPSPLLRSRSPLAAQGTPRHRLEALDLVLALFGLVMLSTGGRWIGRAELAT